MWLVVRVRNVIKFRCNANRNGGVIWLPVTSYYSPLTSYKTPIT